MYKTRTKVNCTQIEIESYKKYTQKISCKLTQFGAIASWSVKKFHHFSVSKKVSLTLAVPIIYCKLFKGSPEFISTYILFILFPISFPSHDNMTFMRDSRKIDMYYYNQMQSDSAEHEIRKSDNLIKIISGDGRCNQAYK